MCMVVTGLAVRVLYITVSHCYRLPLAQWTGFEMADLARSLALGHGFVLDINAGPSAWTAPVYPFLLALVFRVLGVFSNASALTMLVFNSVFAALTSWSIYRIARHVFSEVGRGLVRMDMGVAAQ